MAHEAGSSLPPPGAPISRLKWGRKFSPPRLARPIGIYGLGPFKPFLSFLFSLDLKIEQKLKRIKIQNQIN
jgi:hypothetical protein